MEEKKILSPALQLLDLVWKKSCESKAFSWRAYNHALHEALCLAISSGMRFDRDDFRYIYENYRFHFWGGDGERYYSLAVSEGNVKAAQSYEAKGRKPFIFENVEFRTQAPRKRDRLAVGSKFKWKGEKVEVTSFSRDSKYMVACSFKKNPDSMDDYNRKVKHRYKITNKALKAELKWIKRCREVEAKIKLGGMFHRWILDLFTISTPEENQTRDQFFRKTLRG